MNPKNAISLCRACIVLAMLGAPVLAQDLIPRYGRGVPSAVRLINKRGLAYLKSSQNPDGSWSGGQSGPGITGICVMAMMASGEDPDFGPYAENIRKALLHEPQQYIESVTQVLKIKRPDISVLPSVHIGEVIEHFRGLLANHEVDLLVFGSKDPSQLAMHSIGYSLAVEFEDTPLLLV